MLERPQGHPDVLEGPSIVHAALKRAKVNVHHMFVTQKVGRGVFVIVLADPSATAGDQPNSTQHIKEVVSLFLLWPQDNFCVFESYARK